MRPLPATTDRNGKFLLPGQSVEFGSKPQYRTTGTIVSMGLGWLRVKTPSGTVRVVKPTRAKRVAA